MPFSYSLPPPSPERRGFMLPRAGNTSVSLRRQILHKYKIGKSIHRSISCQKQWKICFPAIRRKQEYLSRFPFFL